MSCWKIVGSSSQSAIGPRLVMTVIWSDVTRAAVLALGIFRDLVHTYINQVMFGAAHPHHLAAFNPAFDQQVKVIELH